MTPPMQPLGDERIMTVLLADDCDADLFFMRTAFKKAGFNNPVQEVHNGEEAIAYLKGETPYSDRDRFPLPAVILLDLNMPMKNGFDLLEWLRTQPVLKRITVVILTASMRREDVQRAFDLGANSFLVKPSAMEDLTAMIRTLGDWLRLNHFPPLK
jgi:CheY-like chemotaxis protein